MISETMGSKIIQASAKQDWSAPLIITLQSNETEGKSLLGPGEGFTFDARSFAPS